jgi:hypothetical protein
VLACGSRLAHHATKETDFVSTQSPLPFPASKKPDAACGILRNDAKACGVAKQGPKGARRAAGYAGSSGGSASSASLPPTSGLARRDIGLHAFDIVQAETTH